MNHLVIPSHLIWTLSGHTPGNSRPSSIVDGAFDLGWCLLVGWLVVGVLVKDRWRRRRVVHYIVVYVFQPNVDFFSSVIFISKQENSCNSAAVAVVFVTPWETNVLETTNPDAWVDRCLSLSELNEVRKTWRSTCREKWNQINSSPVGDLIAESNVCVR